MNPVKKPVLEIMDTEINTDKDDIRIYVRFRVCLQGRNETMDYVGVYDVGNNEVIDGADELFIDGEFVDSDDDHWNEYWAISDSGAFEDAHKLLIDYVRQLQSFYEIG